VIRPSVSLRRRLAWATLLGGGLALIAPGLVLAHPLGNFTVNHYAGLRVEPARIVVDLVIEHWVDTGDFHEGRYGFK